MEIYIEYALVENFLYDFILLALSFAAVRVKVKWRWLSVSAVVGAVFAVGFPLLRLPSALSTAVKIAMGALLCLLPFGRLTKRKDGGKYILVTLLFFAFSFGFGGTLLVVYGPLSTGERVPSYLVFLGFAILSAVGVWLIKRLYARRMLFGSIYTCTLSIGEKIFKADGFYDSGNLAVHKGLPVCFLSTEIFYDIFGEEIAFGGATYEKISFSTVSGTKRATACLGEVEIGLKKGETMIKQVYFSPSPNMVLREYPLLLNSRIFEELSNINKRVGERL